MIPYFGITEAAFALFVAVRFQSWEAVIGLVAIVMTMSLHAFPVPFAPLASAIWAVAGIILISNGKYTIGTLFGISGMVYLCVYLGWGIARYAYINFISDIAFILGLVLVFWPKIFIGSGRSIRRFVSWGNYSEVPKDSELHPEALGAGK